MFMIASYWNEQTVEWVTPGSSMKRMWTDEAKTKRVIKAFIDAEDEKDKDHIGVLMRMFGYESKIKKAEFEKALHGKDKWFFKSKEISAQMKPFNNDLWLSDWEEQNA